MYSLLPDIQQHLCQAIPVSIFVDPIVDSFEPLLLTFLERFEALLQSNRV